MIRVALHKNGQSEFLSLLSAHGVEYDERPHQLDVIMAGPATVLEIISENAPLAAVLVAWFGARASRKVIIQTKNRDVVHIAGYSVKQVSKLLEATGSISIIQADKDDD